MGQNTEITMIVNTQGINQSNVDSHVEFKDNRNNRQPSSDPENFTSIVNPNFEVLWTAEAKNGSEDSINITKIHQKSEKGGVDLLKGAPGPNGENGIFTAQVKNDFIQGLESYYVKFQINGTGQEYTVDPKLEMTRS